MYNGLCCEKEYPSILFSSALGMVTTIKDSQNKFNKLVNPLGSCHLCFIYHIQCSALDPWESVAKGGFTVIWFKSIWVLIYAIVVDWQSNGQTIFDPYNKAVIFWGS